MGPVGTTLEHVMVVGGTPKEWESLTQAEWLALAGRLGAAAGGEGAGGSPCDRTDRNPATTRPRPTGCTGTSIPSTAAAR